MFLSQQELRVLTGRKIKRLQCEQLRRLGIPFFVYASGRPVVTCSAIVGRTAPVQNLSWKPGILNAHKVA